MTRYPPDQESTPLVLEGEWHFGWVLNGLAMQDVWIVPKRSSSSLNPAAPFWTPILSSGNESNGRSLHGDANFLEYGTTIRFFVPNEGEYRAVWAGPRQGKSYVFTAKATEGGLEMLTKEGESDMKWCLSSIGGERFEWKEWVRDVGGEWWVREEFSCRRRK